MQHFASLRQKAREGDIENTILLQRLQERPSETRDKASDWDVSLNEIHGRYGTPLPVRNSDKSQSDQDQLTYYKAVAAQKRGGDALVDHVAQKSSKHLKAHDKEAKRQRVDHSKDPKNLDGFTLSERNEKFNDRL